jgi:integration host factor subunit beta
LAGLGMAAQLQSVEGVAMNKSDLIEEVARVAGLTHEESETIVTAVFERIVQALVKGERVELRGLGTFGVRPRRPRTGLILTTGAIVDVPARKVPFFRMGKELRAILNPEPVPENTHA